MHGNQLFLRQVDIVKVASILPSFTTKAIALGNLVAKEGKPLLIWHVNQEMKKEHIRILSLPTSDESTGKV